MNYLILSENRLDYGWELSAALWKLASPESVQESEGRETTHWSAPIKHPTMNKVALPLPEYTEYIHPGADMAVVLPFLNGVVTSQEAQAAQAKVNEKKGQRMNFSDILTEAPSLKTKIKTQEEMEADGWFPNPEI